MPIDVKKPAIVDPAYADRIAVLVEGHLGINAPDDVISPLLEALGCRTAWFKAGSFGETVDKNGSGWYIRMPAQPDPHNEPLIREVLQNALGYYVANGLCHHPDGFALLHGIHQHERWRDSLNSAEGAYCLASLCAAQALLDGGMQTMQLTGADSGATWLLAILNEWLRPAKPYVEMPLFADLCGALFGDAWYQFAVEHAGVDDTKVPKLIYATRPAFKPGLVAAQIEAVAVVLPALDCA